MIRTLQKKFVKTAMCAVTVLLLVFLAVLNAANYAAVEKDIESTLSVLSDHETHPGNIPLPQFPDQMPFAGMVMSPPKNEYDTVMSSTYFVVRFRDSGEILFADVNRISSITEEEAAELAEEMMDTGNDRGSAGKYRYCLVEIPGQGENVMVFLDTSAERYSVFRVLLFSLVVGAACWGIMLVFVILLSRRAIRPIAENIEKQRQFVTNAGHEIKTPLAIIQANTEAMELYSGETKWSKNIKEQTGRLTGLMKNLLLLSRMDEGAAEAVLSDVCVSEIVNRMLLGFAETMEAKDVQLETDIMPDAVIRANQGQMEQLFSILVDNAVKYTDQGGKITVSLRKEEKSVMFRIENTCRTLPDAAPERLFDRFYRADEARTQKNGGYGIGLSVAQSIVNVYKGSIRAEYIQPDRICFTVLLKREKGI